MQVHSLQWQPQTGWIGVGPTNPQLVLAFGHRPLLSEAHTALCARVPASRIVSVSTSGEIVGDAVAEQSVHAIALSFDHTFVRMAVERCGAPGHSAAAGRALGAALTQVTASPDEVAQAPLRHVLLFSNGLLVNGTALAAGLQACVGPNITITGGLAGDGAAFEQTLVCGNTEQGQDVVVGIGLYGTRLEVGFGSQGGWQRFGPIRQITDADGSVLRTLDGKLALDKYKEYLGEHAASLPGSALMFPLFACRPGAQHGLVRTILSIDNQSGTMTFAGDIPKGGTAQLMHANPDGLVSGAENAAYSAAEMLSGPAELALLVSCVGRRLVLQQRVEEEVEAVRGVVGATATLAGFYSYGELCPPASGSGCELHNQTMTITLLREVADE
jgi:hypothetical protein